MDSQQVTQVQMLPTCSDNAQDHPLAGGKQLHYVADTSEDSDCAENTEVAYTSNFSKLVLMPIA